MWKCSRRAVRIKDEQESDPLNPTKELDSVRAVSRGFVDQLAAPIATQGLQLIKEGRDIALNAEPLAVANGCQHSTTAKAMLSLPGI